MNFFFHHHKKRKCIHSFSTRDYNSTLRDRIIFASFFIALALIIFCAVKLYFLVGSEHGHSEPPSPFPFQTIFLERRFQYATD